LFPKGLEFGLSFMPAKQELYHLSHTSSYFGLAILEMGVL
jgi:hypothetical protein